jgi:toxin ParE1/3/4
VRKLRWEVEASRQFEDALAYISAFNASAAVRLRADALRKVELLRRLPEMGRKGRVAKSRELVDHPNSIVIYTVRTETIDIVGFLHARQLYP